MKFILTPVFLVSLAFAGAAFSSEPHETTGTVPQAATDGHATEPAEPAEPQDGYAVKRFTQCPIDLPPQNPLEETAYGVKLISVFTKQLQRGYLPVSPTEPGAECSVVAVKEGRVVGKVLPRTRKRNSRGFTIVPGEIVDPSKKGLKLMLLEGKDPLAPPEWAPLPCTLQKKDRYLNLVLEYGPEADNATGSERLYKKKPGDSAVKRSGTSKPPIQSAAKVTVASPKQASESPDPNMGTLEEW